ncbi:adenylosuccinate synthase [Pyramidobacter piscolens]|uniref:adenylosuccinate synthase n=1 Tax=Pyramidobacter piscolens TaxID=638849 RepID=UPI002666EE2B|nr:adenylosuccinate synthase [Pyramidobacter piscolens]
MKGKIEALIGAQWGDEGKGRVVDSIGSRVDIFARYQGGANAGHTVYVDGEKYVFRLLPSGMLYPGKTCVIGNGVVIDPEQLLKELGELRARGKDRACLRVSGAAHVVMPYHKLFDQLQEESRDSEHKIGTTGRGIGPCYVDKYTRIGVRVEDLLDEHVLREKLGVALAEKNRILAGVYGKEPLALDPIYEQAFQWGKELSPYVADVSLEVFNALENGQTVLCEGAQGTLLDVDHGTYPMVTSSNPVSSGGCIGLGVGMKYVDRVIGVAKAYLTRVGSGPFPTEDFGPEGEEIRRRGGEFGAVTGRPRRCGWLDLVALRYAVRVNGFTCLALTKLDILTGFKELKVCNSYKVGDKIVADFPSAIAKLAEVEPVYYSLPGWSEDVSAARAFEDLPENARKYVQHIEQVIGVPVVLIGVGPDREQFVLRGL